MIDLRIALPGQGWLLQDWVCSLLPGQYFPPWIGGGLVQVRDLLWVPPAHVALHELHAFHLAQLPSPVEEYFNWLDWIFVKFDRYSRKGMLNRIFFFIETPQKINQKNNYKRTKIKVKKKGKMQIYWLLCGKDRNKTGFWPKQNIKLIEG